MKKLGWFITGIVLGAVAVQQVRDNPAARKAYEDAKSSAQDLRDAVIDGYREREAQLNRSNKKATSSKPKNNPAGK